MTKLPEIPGPRFLAVTPARNEASRLPETARAFLAQTVRPVVWVIVDDGSSDGTGDVADALAREHAFVRVVRRPDRGRRSVGGGVVEAFDAGLAAAADVPRDFVAKVDADVTFGPRYLERLAERFAEDPRLCAASGKVYRPTARGPVEEFIIDEQTSGAFKCWRAEWFAAMGGLVREAMWDGIDLHRARMAGLRTRSFRDPELAITHHRLMGSSDRGVLRGRLRWGRGQYFMGSHPAYMAASAAFRMAEKPYVVGGLCILLGYLAAAFRRAPRYEFPGFRAALHAWQMGRLKRLVRGGGAA